jgi:hypothetical protein
MRIPALLAVLLAAAALAAACHDAVGVDAGAPGGPPTLKVGAPFTGAAPQVLAGRVRFVATCTDPAGPCRSVEVRLNSSLVASGTTGVDSVISLAGISASSGRFVVTATGSHGVVTTDSSPAFTIRPETGWTFVGAVHGYVADSDGERASYDSLDATLVMDLSTRESLLLHVGVDDAPSWVTANGGVAEVTQAVFTGGIHWGIIGIFPFNLGQLTAHAEVRDRWVAWWSNGLLFREDVLTRAFDRSVLLPIPFGFWLSDDGSVVYRDTSAGPGLAVLRPDNTRGPLSADTAGGGMWGMAEGNTAIFARQSGGHAEVVFADAGGTHVLATSGATSEPGVLRDGWAAWTTGTGDTRRLWTRSPEGVVREVAAGTAVDGWSLGWAGTVLLLDGGRAYLSLPPYAARRDIGEATAGTQYRWHRHKLFALTWNAIFSIDP